MDSLFRTLQSISPLNGSAWSDLAKIVSTRQCAANEFLLRAGEVAKKVLFVRAGLLREYYIDHLGNEATRRFCGIGEFSGSLADLLSGAPSTVFIQTLEPANLFEADFKSVDSLSHAHPPIMLLMRRLAEGLYVHKMRREFEMLTLPAAERYRRFSTAEPKLNARLPRHLVASYLGITPVHLSRICSSQK